ATAIAAGTSQVGFERAAHNGRSSERATQPTHATRISGAASVNSRLWLEAAATSPRVRLNTALRLPQAGQSRPVSEWNGHSGTWVVVGSNADTAAVPASAAAPQVTGARQAGSGVAR